MFCFVFYSDGLKRSLRDAKSQGRLQPVKIDASEDPLTGIDMDGSMQNLSNTNPTAGY